MYTSPRTVTDTGAVSRCGIGAMAAMFSVTFSPTVPSPRVAPRVRIPFSYVSPTDSPSIFGSTVKRMSSRATPASRSASMVFVRYADSSSVEKTSVRLPIFTGCVTFANFSDGAPPTWCVGEAGSSSCGYAASKSVSSRNSAS